MEFFDWSILGTLAGAVAAVAVITEITKGLPGVKLRLLGVKRIPTQIWSYVLALIVLICAQAFTAGLTASSAVLALVNAAMVSLAANGGYEAISRLESIAKKEPTDKEE